jgi:hypothetical protein
MSTRSTIALEFADGTVGQVYCHFDGYLSNNGKILLENYTDPFKLQKLIDLGDMSSLGDTIEDSVFYGRDRGEEFINAKYFKNFADYVENHQYEEYEYILRNIDSTAVWFVAIGEGIYIELASAFAKEEA